MSTTPSWMTSAMDLFLGFRLSSTPTSPNWKLPSTMHTRLPHSMAAATPRLTAMVVRPTPPLGEKTVTMRPASCSSAPSSPVAAAAETAARSTMRPSFSRSRRCTWRMEVTSSSALNGLTRNSRAPASIERRR